MTPTYLVSPDFSCSTTMMLTFEGFCEMSLEKKKHWMD